MKIGREGLERAARAMFDQEWGGKGGEREFEQYYDYWMRAARAAAISFGLEVEES